MGDAAIAPLTLLAVAQDAGGGNAIAPVVQRWCAAGGRACCVVAGPAADAFAARELPAFHPPVEGAPMTALRETAARVLDRERPDVVLAGTSWGPAIDKAMVAEAAIRHVPTVAVIDAAGYYRERFSDIESMRDGLLYLPDRIGVMDEVIRQEAQDAGIPPSLLVVTGQPYFDDLRERAATVTAEAERLRRSVRATGPIVVFASERLARDFPEGTPWYRGYTERDAFAGLQAAASRLDPPVTLVAKQHPQEERWAGPGEDDHVIVWKDVPSLVAIGAADVLVGMTSTFLFEAALIGKPTISFQPGDRPAVDAICLRLGLTPLTRTERELETALRAALSAPVSMRGATTPAGGGAAARVIHELHAVMSSKAGVR